MKTWVGLIVIKDQKVLFVKEHDEDFYVLPGGLQEAGETVEQCLHREITEELRTEPARYEFFNEYQLISRGEGDRITFKVFIGTLAGGITPGEDIESIAWLDSFFREQGIQIGHLPDWKVMPELKARGLIV